MELAKVFFLWGGRQAFVKVGGNASAGLSPWLLIFRELELIAYALQVRRKSVNFAAVWNFGREIEAAR